MELTKEAVWGRAEKASSFTFLSALGLMIFAPLMVFYFHIAITHFHGSLWAPIAQFQRGELTLNSYLGLLPAFSMKACLLWLGWLTFQFVLAQYMPDYLNRVLPSYRGGKLLGGVTPLGNRLPYKVNGLQVWVVTHVLFITGGFVFGLFSPTVIVDNWGGLLWAVNITGYLLAFYVFIKAHLFPSRPVELKKSQNLLYDFYMGMELNPRIRSFDFKLFFNGRPGIVAWTLINLSFAAEQYVLYGTVTNSMILVNFFHLLYVLYFFWEEAWYLNTIDIHHDHFGWMLAWGDCVWLPYMYTLQGFYLVYNPVSLSSPYTIFVLCFGLLGYFIFHSANRQKERFRQTDGNTTVWGKKPNYVSVSYKAKDGELKQSKLLTSGWWGVARHFNYTGDLILSLAYSLACGFQHILPYFYFIFLFILLIHRCIRDEERLSKKYGEGWIKYRKAVPYRLIPKLF
jgi:7-dehydrocholesterol reductase